MEKGKEYHEQYTNLLNRFDLPLVYHFAAEHRPEQEVSDPVRFVPSTFYQSPTSFAYLPHKPISKILTNNNEKT